MTIDLEGLVGLVFDHMQATSNIEIQMLEKPVGGEFLLVGF